MREAFFSRFDFPKIRYRNTKDFNNIFPRCDSDIFSRSQCIFPEVCANVFSRSVNISRGPSGASRGQVHQRARAIRLNIVAESIYVFFLGHLRRAPRLSQDSRGAQRVFPRSRRLPEVQKSTSEFSRSLMRDLGNSRGAKAFSGFVGGLVNLTYASMCYPA